jgi:hypothetical protein
MLSTERSRALLGNDGSGGARLLVPQRCIDAFRADDLHGRGAGGGAGLVLGDFLAKRRRAR